MSSAAIIGAGITGLVAAWRLKSAGVPVTIYEAAPRAGGVIRSIRQDGWLAECGPNTILETSPKIARLITELGLAQRKLEPDPKAENRYVVRNKKPVALPGSALQFFFSPLFSPSAKLRLLKEPFIPRSDHEESVSQFVQRRLGREFLDYAIDPMVSGIYAGDPARLSILHAFPKIHELETRYGSLIKGQILGASERKKRGEISKATAPKFSFDEGVEVLPGTLAQKLGDDLRLDCAVRSIARRGAAWEIGCEHQGKMRHQSHSIVLYAGTAHQLSQLQFEPAEAGTSSFAEIFYPSVASVVLGFKREDVRHPLDGFGALVPSVEGFRILGTIFSSSLFPNRAPSGHVLLTTYVGGARKGELALQPSETLVKLVQEDLGILFGATGAPVFQHTSVFKHAIPQYNVGYGRFKQRMNELESMLPGFFLAGHFRHGVSLSDSILSGMTAAEKVEAFLGKTNSEMAPPASAAREHHQAKFDPENAGKARTGTD